MRFGAFKDRKHAAAKLADLIAKPPAVSPDTLLLGLVRGGAVVASELAGRLGLAWDIYVVRKIGAPAQREYAVGAVCEQGAFIFNHDVLEHFGLASDWQAEAISLAQSSCTKLQTELRRGKPLCELAGRDVILCDDGMATGLTMQVAIEGVRSEGANSICVAVPVLSTDALKLLRAIDVQGYYLGCPKDFRAVGLYYQDFRPVETEDVGRLLAGRTN